jgi:MFS transporter, MCT family, solute carrier family 16 (monocarboxylic acid transporters), member 10
MKVLFVSIACGAYVSLSGIPIMSFGSKEDAGRRMGVFQTAMAVSALAGAPISGVIHDATHGYIAVGVYAGQ